MVLRELFVKIGFEIDGNKLSQAEHAIKRFTERLVDKGFELAESFAHQVEQAVEFGDKIKKTSQAIGIATDALQELQYAGSLADLSAEEMSQSIGILSRKMLEAKDGSKEAGKAFQGIKFQENGKLLATEEVLGNIADKFQSMPDGAEKTAMAMQLFGRAGKQMIPLLNKGSKDLEELREEARAFGLVLDKEAVEQSEELNDNLHRLHAIGLGLMRQVIGPMIPVLSKLVKQFLEWRKENAKLMAEKIEKYIGLVIKWIGILGATVKAVGSQTIIFAKNIGAAFVSLWNIIGPGGQKAVGLLGAAFAALKAGPLGVALAAFTFIMDVLDDIRGYREGEDSLFGTFKDEIASWLKPNDRDPWWLTALKDMVELMAKALGLAKDLGITSDDAGQTGEKKRGISRIGQIATSVVGANPGKVGAALDRQFAGLEGLRGKLARGEVRGKHNFFGGTSYEDISDPVERAKAAAAYAEANAPYMRAKSGSGGTSVSAPVHINVMQQPGENGQDFANRVMDQVREFWNGQLETVVPR